MNRGDLQAPELSARVELFVLDGTTIGDATVHRFHSGINPQGTPVIWQGETYNAMPIEGEGFEKVGRGTTPRPSLRVANVSGLLSALCEEFDDLIGAKLTRKLVLSKYLDAANFAAGNPTADPTAGFPDDVWFVFRKSRENKALVEFDLCAPFDVEGIRVPRRSVVSNVCTWVYRSPECSYAGGAVAKADDTPTAILGEDVCGKRITSCRLRFAGQLPYGGFAGAGRIGT